jgi:hypothetical protein
MPLTDLFNPTFFMFLGILLLVVALLVVYFENKMRDQNHKIASMLSLVSTLAEDMNGVKFGLNHLARNTMATNVDPLNTAFISSDENKLITVSDDENDSDEESVSTFEINDESEGEDEEDNDNEESSEDDELSSHNDVKVLKLNISKEADENEEYDENENLDDLEDLDDSLSETSNLETSEFVDDQPELMENLEDLNEGPISASELKTININLEEPLAESLDYKKLPLPKLRSIVAEKGLSSDASKLKKNELLKLLGAE